MPDDDFQFADVLSVGESLCQVRQAGRFLGTVAEERGGWQATRVLAGGAVRSEWFPDREAAALWLLSITPTRGR
jgi:hypothetical protein